MSAVTRAFLFSFLAFLVLAASINLAVDPYGYFGIRLPFDLAQNKSTSFEHDRFFKAGLATRSTAQLLLAGSSRVGEGLPAGSEQFASIGPALDVSLAGPNVGEMTSIVDLAETRNPVKRVFLGLDFFAFNALREMSHGGRPQVFDPRLIPKIETVASLLFSSDTLLDSASTIWPTTTVNFYLPSGQVNRQFLLRKNSGRPTRTIFVRSIRGYIHQYLPAPEEKFELNSPNASSLGQLESFLVEQHRKRISVTLFFAPCHAWQAELIDALGLWPQYEQWERDVASTNERASSDSGEPIYAIWRFPDYDGPTAEAVPADYQSFRPMKYYWDSSHFNEALGALVIDQLIHPDRRIYGDLLTLKNLENLINLNRAARQRWRLLYPNDHAEVSNIVSCFASPAVREHLHLVRPPESVYLRLAAMTR